MASMNSGQGTQYSSFGYSLPWRKAPDTSPFFTPHRFHAATWRSSCLVWWVITGVVLALSWYPLRIALALALKHPSSVVSRFHLIPTAWSLVSRSSGGTASKVSDIFIFGLSKLFQLFGGQPFLTDLNSPSFQLVHKITPQIINSTSHSPFCLRHGNGDFNGSFGFISNMFPYYFPKNSSGIWVHHASSTLSWAIPASSPLSRLHLVSRVFSQKGPSWCFLGLDWLDVSHGVSTWARFPLSPHFSLCQVAKSGTSPLMSSSSLPTKALATLEKSQVPWWLSGPPKNSNNSSLSEAGLNCSGQHLINRRSPSNQPNRATGGQVPFEILFCLRG